MRWATTRRFCSAATMRSRRSLSIVRRRTMTWTEDDPYWQARQYQETAQMIEDLTPITIAAVDGVCTGGGLELTLVCDFVVATDRSRWGMPEIDWDITPGWGGVTRLARFAGRRKTKELNLIG